MTTPEERRQQLRDLINEQQKAIFQSLTIRGRREPRATYDAAGRIIRSGGTAQRTRGRFSNAAQRAGRRVSVTDGNVQGQARNDNGRVAADLQILTERVDKAVTTIPMQVGTGDPNNETTPGTLDVLPRYDADVFYDTDSGTFWRWFSDSESDPAEPEWVVVNQLLQGFTGDPNDQGGSPIPVYVDGAKAIRDDGTEFTGAITGDTWTGEISDFNGVFGATEDGTYTLITNSTKALKVLAVTTSGAATLTLSPTVGNTISAGGTLTGTVGSADGNPLYFTVRLETV
jgi:hypothetical protein